MEAMIISKAFSPKVGNHSFGVEGQRIGDIQECTNQGESGDNADGFQKERHPDVFVSGPIFAAPQSLLKDCMDLHERDRIRGGI